MNLHQTLTVGALVALIGACALVPGCKNNASAAATPERVIGTPPKLIATRVSAEDAATIRTANPSNSPAWKGAHWAALSAPINATVSTPPTWAAVLFDDASIYVAFTSQRLGRGKSDAVDNISLYVDPTNSGRELLQVSLDADSDTPRQTWFRCSAPPKPREDGTPDFAYPVSGNSDFKITGLWCTRGDDADGWTAVIGMPLQNLPPVLRNKPVDGKSIKINLVRTITTTSGGRRTEELQSNFSPIFVDAQPVSPYRMSDLQFGQ